MPDTQEGHYMRVNVIGEGMTTPQYANFAKAHATVHECALTFARIDHELGYEVGDDGEWLASVNAATVVRLIIPGDCIQDLIEMLQRETGNRERCLKRVAEERERYEDRDVAGENDG